LGSSHLPDQEGEDRLNTIILLG